MLSRKQPAGVPPCEVNPHSIEGACSPRSIANHCCWGVTANGVSSEQVTATRKEATALEEARQAEAAAAYAAAAEARELSKMLTEVEEQLGQER